MKILMSPTFVGLIFIPSGCSLQKDSEIELLRDELGLAQVSSIIPLFHEDVYLSCDV